MKNLFIALLASCCTSSISLWAGNNENETLVLIETDMGKIKVKLLNETPRHRDNFLKHVQENHYNGMIFHRVIRQFMIQGGGERLHQTPEDSLRLAEQTNYTLPAEFVYPEYFHKKGMLCAARTGDENNPHKASSSTQFYIVTGKYYTEMELNKMEKEKTSRSLRNNAKPICMKEALRIWTGTIPCLDRW